MMRIAVLQHDIVFEGRDATLRQLAAPIARAAGSGAHLIALTEMFATGFSMRTQLTAEPLDGPTATWMQEQARTCGAAIAGSVPLIRQPSTGQPEQAQPTNTLLVAHPDGRLDQYDKIHPFSYAGEHERFQAGKAPATIELHGLRIGLSVCYDLRFAYLYWDRAAHTDVELVVANWPAARRDHWLALLQARAIENQTYVIGANRIGAAGTVTYAGDSRIYAPNGNVLAAAGDTATTLTADLDAEVVRSTRAAFPVAADRTR